MTKASSAPKGLGWIIAASSFGFVVVQLDVTIVNVALPALARDLHGDAVSLQWMVDAYTAVFAILLLSAGVLGDLIGSRKVYLSGFGLFALSSLACGLAPNATMLIGARAFQGMGAALMVPNALAVLNHATSHDAKARARAVGLWTGAGSIAIGAGPVLSGILLSDFGWRSIFLVNLPICALGVILTVVFVPATPRRADPARRLDLPGQMLAALALLGLIGGVIEGRPLGWSHPIVILAAVLFLTAGTGFWMVERHSRAPLLPLKFFASPRFTAAIGFGVAVNLAYYGILFVLALYLQNARHWSALQAGLAILPLTATLLVSNLLSGWMIARFGSRLPMVIGGCVGAVGYGLMTLFGANTSFWAMLPAFLLIPSGMGLGVPAMTTAILASVERSHAGTAAAVLNAARQAAAATGVAVFGALASYGGAAHGLNLAAAISCGLLACAAFAARMWASKETT